MLAQVKVGKAVERAQVWGLGSRLGLGPGLGLGLGLGLLLGLGLGPWLGWAHLA
jgi:hypothetical protein